MKRYYKVNQRNSTVCGYRGRDFDWSLFCWDESQIHKALFKGDRNMKAPKVFVDNRLIEVDSEYLHVPYDWVESGTSYRVRPNESMRAGQIYRGKKILKQTALKRKGEWYWCLELGVIQRQE